MNKNFKELRKAAFAVGFGFTIGKAMADWVVIFVTPLMMAPIEMAADNGSETARRMLDAGGIEYKKESSSANKDQVKMGSKIT